MEEEEQDFYESQYTIERYVVDDVNAEDTPSALTILELVAAIRERMHQLSAAVPDMTNPPLDSRISAMFPPDTDLITLILSEMITPGIAFPILVRRGNKLYRIGKPSVRTYMTEMGYFPRGTPSADRDELTLDWHILDMRVSTTVVGDSSFDTIIRDMVKYGNVGSVQLLNGAKKYLETRLNCANAEGQLGAHQ